MHIKKWVTIGAAVIAIALALPVYFAFWTWTAPWLLERHYAGVPCRVVLGFVIRGDVIVSGRSVCAGERAWFENEIAFCDLSDDRDICLGWMAIKIGDPQICRQLSGSGGGWVPGGLRDEDRDLLWLYSCYRSMANMRHDSSLCELIPFLTNEYLQECKDTAEAWGQHYLDFDQSPIS